MQPVFYLWFYTNYISSEVEEQTVQLPFAGGDDPHALWAAQSSFLTGASESAQAFVSGYFFY